MHTRAFEDEEIYFHHNRDLSGDVIISVRNHRVEHPALFADKGTYHTVSIPGDIMIEFIGRWLLDERISALEEVEDVRAFFAEGRR